MTAHEIACLKKYLAWVDYNDPSKIRPLEEHGFDLGQQLPPGPLIYWYKQCEAMLPRGCDRDLVLGAAIWHLWFLGYYAELFARIDGQIEDFVRGDHDPSESPGNCRHSALGTRCISTPAVLLLDQIHLRHPRGKT